VLHRWVTIERVKLNTSPQTLFQQDKVESFYNWINERHKIYQKRLQGYPPPWTDDPILQKYKFTNPFRENDRVTVWMRNNWTIPNDNKKNAAEIIFNCCLFRMIGTIEFAEDHGWVKNNWNPEKTKKIIEDRLSKKQRTFTGAYIITNQGISAPKKDVVVDEFLIPIWKNKNAIAENAAHYQTLQKTHEKLGEYKGWGGGGFMAYEVVSDLNYTSVLNKATDRYTWANAGPGAIRGINRIEGANLKRSMKPEISNEKMQKILNLKYVYTAEHIDVASVDMRTIEHSLCEWDKYERVRLNQGRPRSKFSWSHNKIDSGGVR